jgi:hypothetical protein
LVAYLKYQDVFTKRSQESWMGMRIRPDASEHKRITQVGGDLWNEWT